jgi:two-component system phosphate regulon sensor histidine kinase PhoR
MRLGWSAKIGLTVALPVILGVGVFLLLATRQMTHVTRDTIEAELVKKAQVLAHALAERSTAGAALQPRVRKMGQAIRARVTVIDPAGVVLADSDANPIDMENHGQRPEIVAAKQDGTGVSERFSQTVKRKLLYAAVRVPGNDATVVRIARDMSAVEAELAKQRRSFWLIAGVVVVLAIVGGMLLARASIRPVLELTAAARRVEAGDLDARVAPTRDDEVGRLGQAFNLMTQQLKETLQAAQDEATRLTTILEGMTEGVVAIDGSEKVSFLNGAAREILALGRNGELAGKPFYEVVRDPKILALARVQKASEAEIGYEGPPRRLIEVYAAPVGDRGVILVLRDLSRLRRLERMRSDFVSAVSHELRTPLASIAAAAETLGDDDARLDGETGPKFVDIIRRNASRLEALLQDILALSRFESRPETLPREPVDFAAVVRSGAEELRQRAQKAGLHLQVDAPGSLKVIGDVTTLRRIVDNLIVNAITYTPEGGEVRVGVTTENGTVLLTVSDTGIGIPEESLDRIFERFYRVDKARSRSAGGTGLGLAIVKHATGLHGGSIAVESEVGEGTTFKVRLPLAPEDSES